MEHLLQDSLEERRALTDASLETERASADTTSASAKPAAQRLLDDLIERDRLAADERLLKFREGVDSLLARERRAAPARDSSVETERRVADEDKKAERKVTDALLEAERLRSDAAVEAERREHDSDRAQMDGQRQDTDDKLSTERQDADDGKTKLEQTTHALAAAHSDRGRRNDVFGMVTHDLRNPLCVISVNAECIGADAQDPSIREAAQQISLSAVRMGRLLADLMDVARVEAGTLRVVRRSHDVGELMTEIQKAYRPLFAERKMTFVVEVPALPTTASFDHDRVIQVLSNLLGNAMKFTPAGATVRLRVEVRDHEVELALSDDGPGIDADSVPHLFKRFWQIDNEARRGLGLGLYISEQIVKAHEGHIWVESERGKGATFRFTLPRTEPAQQPGTSASARGVVGNALPR